MNRCNSGTDGIVRMKESENKCCIASACIFAPPVQPFCACRGFLFPQNNGGKHEQHNNKNKADYRRKLVFTALLSAMAVVLMKFLAFKIPIMPGFISFDFSDVPAVLASLTMGPVSGVAVCLIKNLGGFLLAGSMTGGVGEVSNFILGCLLVIPAGLIANRTGHSMKHVVLACLAGAVSMALVGVATNYFIVYPLYTAVMPMEAIIGMYQAIWSGADSLIKCLVVFNLPFTFVKGLIAVLISLPLYKRLRPIFNSNFRTEI